MLVENFITYFARKKNADYLQFTSSASPALPPRDKDTPTLLYMHVPFCEELCPYCSFNRVVFKEDVARAYHQALRKEILMYKNLGYDFRALYVGGGTPTVLIEELGQTIALIKDSFHISEISVETNPNHLTEANIDLLKEMGVNRLSVGVQTFDDGILKTVERYHKYGSGAEIVERLMHTQGHFDTLNADMIFNFPTQTMEILEEDLSTLNDLRIDQITYYPLMVSAYTQEAMSRKLGVVNYSRGNQLYLKITQMLAANYTASTAWCFSRKDRMVGAARAPDSSDQRLLSREGEATRVAGSDASSDPTSTQVPGEIGLQSAEGATRAPVKGEALSTHGVREGEAPTAGPGEGATRAPVIDEYVVNYDEYAGLGSGSIGYLAGTAYANTFDIMAYIHELEVGRLPLAAKKIFSMKERMRYDFLMKLFGLTLDLQQVSIKHGESAHRYLWPEIFFFRLTGGIIKEGSTLRLTRKGQYYWVLMMREFFIGVNNFRDYCRAQLKASKIL
jgi:coproporphyrinogen III oxidase-like Fe-S oxidoreductase